MLSTEDDPKRQEHSIEDPLTNISKKQHPSPVKTNRKPLYGNVYESHRDSKSKDYLFQEHRWPCHLHNPSPIPNHDDENAGCKECFHGKPDFCEASILMNTH
uniref:Uncharacterized protein n=1 Tax=Micrurus surinamensis TaxID=129470 RepID=A0A2D4Q2I2_MICSU